MQDKYQRTASLLPISYTVSNICTVFTPKSIKACIIHLQTWLELLDFWSWTCKVLFERIDYNLWDYIWELKWMAFIQHRCYYYNSIAIFGNVKHTYVIEHSHFKIVFMAVLKINRMIYLCTYVLHVDIKADLHTKRISLIFAQIYRKYHISLQPVLTKVKLV